MSYSFNKSWGVVVSNRYQEYRLYKMCYGDLVYCVDHYFYSQDSKEMKYLMGTETNKL